MGLTEEPRIWGTVERVSDDSEQSKEGEPACTPPSAQSLSPPGPQRGVRRAEESRAKQSRKALACKLGRLPKSSHSSQSRGGRDP